MQCLRVFSSRPSGARRHPPACSWFAGLFLRGGAPSTPLEAPKFTGRKREYWHRAEHDTGVQRTEPPPAGNQEAGREGPRSPS